MDSLKIFERVEDLSLPIVKYECQLGHQSKKVFFKGVRKEVLKFSAGVRNSITLQVSWFEFFFENVSRFHKVSTIGMPKYLEDAILTHVPTKKTHPVTMQRPGSCSSYSGSHSNNPVSKKPDKDARFK